MDPCPICQQNPCSCPTLSEWCRENGLPSLVESKLIDDAGILGYSDLYLISPSDIDQLATLCQMKFGEKGRFKLAIQKLPQPQTAPTNPRRNLQRQQSSPSPPPLTHSIKGHSYEVLEELGKGGFGVVWKAIDVRTRAFVAIKQHTKGPQTQQTNWFEREVQNLEAIRHPSVPRVPKLISASKADSIIVMDFIPGDTAYAYYTPAPEYIRAQPKATKFLLQMLETLEKIHESGIFHRDIKPENILIHKYTLEPWIVDFGIARVLTAQTPLTKIASLYLPPPENPDSEVGCWTDIFSLGATLLSLTGLATDDDYEWAAVLQRCQWTNDFKTVVAKMIAPNWRDRYQTCPDVAEALKKTDPLHASGHRDTTAKVPQRTKQSGRKTLALNQKTLENEDLDEKIMDLKEKVFQQEMLLHNEKLRTKQLSVEKDRFEEEKTRFRKQVEDLRKHLEALERENAELKNYPTVGVPHHRQQSIPSPRATSLPVPLVSLPVPTHPIPLPPVQQLDQAKSPTKSIPLRRAVDVGSPLKKLRSLSGHTNYVLCICPLADGTLLSGSADKTLKKWDAAGKCTKTFEGHYDGVLSVAQLSDGTIASSSTDKTIKLWDINTGQCLRTLEGHDSPVYCVIQLANGTLASSSDSAIKIWDHNTGQCLNTLEGGSHINCICELSNGMLCSASFDKRLQIWDLNTNKSTKTLFGHTDWIYSVTQLADGTLASAARDKTIKIWNPTTTVCLRTLEGHTDTVLSVIQLQSSPIEGTLVSASRDKTIKIWDSKTGECLQTLEGHKDSVNSLVQLSNGTIVSASWDKTIKIWGASNESRRIHKS